MAKKTRWFPCSIEPVRNGWYEVGFSGFSEPQVCLFSGGRWRRFENGEKATGALRPGYWRTDKWRGLAK